VSGFTGAYPLGGQPVSSRHIFVRTNRGKTVEQLLYTPVGNERARSLPFSNLGAGRNAKPVCSRLFSKRMARFVCSR
jgi:hypothetical protein